MSKKKKILIADNVYTGFFNKFPKRKYDIEDVPGISNEDILDKDCDVLVIRSTRKLSKDFINRFNGSVIATFTKGTDHINIAACKKKGIAILSANEGNSQSAAEHTLALILAAAKNLLYSDNLVREGKFSELNYKRTELYGKKIGIVGFGSIGKRVAKMCGACGMKVFANDIDTKVVKKNKKTAFKSLKFILKNCDIVSIHIPLENNVNFIDKEKLSLLKGDSILVNTSRGEVIDERYLIKLLQENGIKFACLDVFKDEPNINTLFLGLDNVILSNHIAGKTEESKIRIAEEVSSKLLKFMKKKE